MYTYILTPLYTNVYNGLRYILDTLFYFASLDHHNATLNVITRAICFQCLSCKMHSKARSLETPSRYGRIEIPVCKLMQIGE